MKTRYQAMVNGEIKYKDSSSPRNAYLLFKREAQSKFGVFKITDLRMETTKNHYSKIQFNLETGYPV